MQIEITKNLRVKAETYQTRYSWGHKAWLYLNEQEIAEAKIRYYNRTWEAWDFATVIEKLYTQAKNEKLLSKYHLRLFKKMIDNQGKVEEKKVNNQFKTIAKIASFGDVISQNQKESNKWKATMLKAGLNLEMPEDWDSLSEAEKEQRLNKVINYAKGN